MSLAAFSPLEVLVVGVGSIGQRHVRCLQATGRARVAICETNAELRTSVASQYGLTRTFATLDEALAEAPQAAVVATPAPNHIPTALRLAEAGVHLLVEKPLSVEETGVAELLECVQRRGLAAGVAYVYRLHPALSEARAALVAGAYGRPLQVVAVAGQHFPAYRPAYRATYYVDRDAGGGAVQDALTHVLNAVQWCVGSGSCVAADAGRLALDGVSVEDTAHVLARHGRVLACYALNQHQCPNENSLTIVCERATVRVEFHRNRWRVMSGPDRPWEDHDVVVPDRDALFVAQAQRLIDAACGLGALPCSLAEGWETLRLQRAVLAAIDAHAVAGADLDDRPWRRLAPTASATPQETP